MQRPQETSKQLKRLAKEVSGVVSINSAGEMGRGQNWSFFVKHLEDYSVLGNYSLVELAVECFDAMTKEHKRMFKARLTHRGQSL